MDAAFWDRGRAFLESRMGDTCRITRPADPVPDEDREIDPDTLEYVDPPPVIVYQGKCRIPRRGTSAAQGAEAGEAEFQVGEYPLALPVVSDDYVADQEVTLACTVTYLTAVRDQDLVGRSFGITGLGHQTDATERRFRMKEVVGP